MYTAFDRRVASYRFRAAAPHVKSMSKVCDIGCGPGAPFLASLEGRIAFGVGLDHRPVFWRRPSNLFVVCDITEGLPLGDGLFDHAVMLAVLEHLRAPRPTLAEAFRVLAPGGSLILTYPHQIVDPLLALLRKTRVIGAALEGESHQKRLPIPELLGLLRNIGFERPKHYHFELRLNNLIIAYKPQRS